jgi:serine phosphatase RsbU (regulator of sigma subunit)/Tfp pilus assembly protein PilF
MHKKHLLVILVLFVFSIQNTKAQTFADKSFYLLDSLNLETLLERDKILIDTLLQEYHESKEDSIKLNCLNVLISECENEVWVRYNNLLIDKSKKLIQKTKKNIYKKHLASGYNNYGFYYYGNDDIPKAVSNFEKAIQLSVEIDDLAVIPTALNNLGYIFKQQGDVLKALEYYHRSLKINRELNEQEEVALSLNNIGSIYYYQKEYEKAINYYRDALMIEKEHGTKKGVARLYSNIGSIYKEQNKNDLAIDYFNQSIKIYTEIGYSKGLATSLSKKATIELSELEDKNDKEALNKILTKHKQAFDLFDALDDNEGRAFSMSNISLTLEALKDYAGAKRYAEKSFQIAKEIGYPESIKSAANILKNIAVLKRDFEEAYLMQELYYQMQDSISSESIKEVTIQKQYQYEYEKKFIKDSLATAEAEKIKDIKYNQQIKQQQTYVLVGFVGLMLMGIVALVIYRGYRLKKKSNYLLEEKNKLIEEKNKEITDSITYAKRIQEAILPAPSLLNKHLKDGFVLYKPKDIVAGDFYWMHPIDSDTVLFAVADCTGHGVPGAMVSVVCHHALNRSVREYNLTDPGLILDKTREFVIDTFAQNNEFNVRDGMDIALCAINYKKKTLRFSGANNPLYVVSTNEETISSLPTDSRIEEEYNTILHEIKGDKQPIGNYNNELTPFTTHTITINKKDVIYLFTDGYADQFGGEKGKKLKYKTFKKLLMLNSQQKMDDQRNLLNKFFNEWREDMEQVDDICVLGIRI